METCDDVPQFNAAHNIVRIVAAGTDEDIDGNSKFAFVKERVFWGSGEFACVICGFRSPITTYILCIKNCFACFGRSVSVCDLY